jgi:maleamate amidohydrolase
MRPWEAVIPTRERDAYDAAGFGKSSGCGVRPALLIIDMQYRTTGTVRLPFWEAVKEFPTSCGETAWDAVTNTKRLLQTFRQKQWPVLYPHVAPKHESDGGRLAAKVPAIMTIPKSGYEFVSELAPNPGDILIPKKHPSAFFGTSLASHLIDLQIDTVVVAGCTTSGCIRASVVDAFSYNLRVLIPQECVYDRSAVAHAVNLFDMNQKYGDVVSIDDALNSLNRIAVP